MNEFAIIVGGGLSVYAIVSIWMDSDGPGDVLLRTRLRIGVDVPYITTAEDGISKISGYMRNSEPEGFLASLLSCKLCMASWATFIIWLLYILSDSSLVWFIFSPVGLAYFLWQITHD